MKEICRTISHFRIDAEPRLFDQSEAEHGNRKKKMKGIEEGPVIQKTTNGEEWLELPTQCQILSTPC